MKPLRVLLPCTAALLCVLPAGLAHAGPLPQEDGTRVMFAHAHRLARGVTLHSFQTTAAGKPVLGEEIEVDLRAPGVSVGLLHPPAVAQRMTVSAMAAAEHALAGVNGDFFNITETHPGVQPTGSSVGPEIADGRPLKAAVPDGQRFGPAMPAGATTEDVIDVGTDRVARLADLHLTGTVSSPTGLEAPLGGLNQYALPVGGIGAFTVAWGGGSRVRATCGTDTVRTAACSTDTAEAAISHGVVTAVGTVDATGPVARNTTVLVGRDQGAVTLRALHPGDHVKIAYRLTRDVRFAVGGFPLLRDGQPTAPLDATAAPRTAAGIADHGHRLLLVIVDGRSTASAGLGLPDLASLLRTLGADDALNLDGGGSTTLVARDPGQQAPTVRNVPSDGTERPVANGIGVFARP